TRGKAPAKKKLLTSVSIGTQLQSRMGNLTTLLPSMEQAANYSVATQEMLLQNCRREVDEALRLAKLDPALHEEVARLFYMQTGLQKARAT
ncbi:unnamed protein product, partial [Ectocarpus sp. 4 AP-2014]